MATVTLADPISGIGTVAGIARFADVDDNDVNAKDRYVLHPVDPFQRMLGIGKSDYIDAAVAAFEGINPDKVFYEIVRLPQHLIDIAEANGGDIGDDDIDGNVEEIWVAAFGDLNDGAGVSLENVQFVRVA